GPKRNSLLRMNIKHPKPRAKTSCRPEHPKLLKQVRALIRSMQHRVDRRRLAAGRYLPSFFDLTKSRDPLIPAAF
ncbi:MAG: hypothetical protein K2X55_16565, partial [Burkholderiaceae bacterium]|nr:hypothetical protein [Burkholderiaceae bacterium]